MIQSRKGLVDLADLLGPIENTNRASLQCHTAVVCGRDDLLLRAMGSFLESKGWDVVRLANNGEAQELIQKAEQLHPEVIVLCQEKAEDESVLPLSLINRGLCSKVITIGMDSNLLHVYSKQHVVLQGASDLLAIMESGNCHRCTSEKEVDTNRTDP